VQGGHQAAIFHPEAMSESLSEHIILLGAFCAFVLSTEVGYRLGRNYLKSGDQAGGDHVKGLQAALLGLLSLLLGFSFAMATSRFDARKALVQEEVNSIGTVWQRAELLDAPLRDRLAELLRAYVDARVDFMKAGTDASRLDMTIDEASVREREIWDAVRQASRDNKGGANMSLIVPALNDMVNLKWKRRTMMDNHVPAPVLFLLFSVAAGAFVFIGFNYGLSGRRRYISSAFYAGLISLVLATIIDIDRARTGLIQIDEKGLTRLQEAIGIQDR
jgi:hypothetical protein